MQYASHGRYLAFPVADGAPLTRMRLAAADMVWLFDVQMVPPEKAGYWVYFDALYCTGQPVSLHSEAGVPEQQWREWVAFEDTFPGREGLFSEPHRPLYHFTSSRGWINDPNGLVKKDGRYHMFYQLNPFGCRGYDKGWGHCVSENLFDWKVLPPALSADEAGYAISGCTLFDTQGRAGFGRGAWVMAYSPRMHERPQLGQRQNIAYSTDGQRFHKYAGNPVLCDDTILDFRDPKVFWCEAKQYFVMLVAAGPQLRFYASEDLKHWRLLSTVEDDAFHPEGWIYECPDLLEYPLPQGGSIWALSFSWIEDRSVRFLFGQFDGTAFRAAPGIPLQRADWGRDFYAAVAWDPYGEMNGRKLWIAWMCYWPYSAMCPQDEGWLNMFTVPRELELSQKADGTPFLCQRPADELQQLVCRREAVPDAALQPSGQELLCFPEAYCLSGTLARPRAGGTAEFCFCFDSGERVMLAIQGGTLLADRSQCNCCGIGQGYEQVQAMPLNGGDVPFLILGDRNCMELYFDGGEHCMSLLCHARSHTGRLHVRGGEGQQLKDVCLSALRKAQMSV